MGVRDWFGDLFGKGGHLPNKGQARTTPPHRRPPPARLDEAHWVEQTLDDILESDDPLWVFSLDSFSRAVGAETWTRIRGRSLMLAEGTLRNELGQSIRLFQGAGPFFLAHIPPGNPPPAKLAMAAAIALGKRLVGAKFTVYGADGGAGIELTNGRPSDLLAPDGSVREDSVRALLPNAHLIDGEGRLVRDGSAHSPSDEHSVETESAASKPETGAHPLAGKTRTPSMGESDPSTSRPPNWQPNQGAAALPGEDGHWIGISRKRKRSDPVWIPIERPKG